MKGNSSKLIILQKGGSYVKDILKEIMDEGKLRRQPVSQGMIDLAHDIDRKMKNQGFEAREI